MFTTSDGKSGCYLLCNKNDDLAEIQKFIKITSFCCAFSCKIVRHMYSLWYVCGLFVCHRQSITISISIEPRTHGGRSHMSQGIICGWQIINMGLYSLSRRTSYRKISWRLEAARSMFKLLQSLWNLTGTSTTTLRRCLSNVWAIRSLKHPMIDAGAQTKNETCSCCGRDTWHIKSKQILQPPKYLKIIVIIVNHLFKQQDY